MITAIIATATVTISTTAITTITDTTARGRVGLVIRINMSIKVIRASAQGEGLLKILRVHW